MLNKPLSKILLGVIFKAAFDFVSEINEERQRVKTQADDTASFSKTLVDQKEDKHMSYQNEQEEGSGFGSGLLLGGLVGSVIGAGLALFYAPQTGKKTQAMLKREANRMQKNVSKEASHLHDTAEEIVNNVVERTSELTEQGREFAKEKASVLKKAIVP